MRIVLLALAVGTLGLVSGVAQPGAVRLGVFGDLAGPAAFLGQALLDGTTLAVEQINAQGGISGRQLELVVRDASTSDRAVQAVEELIFTEEVLLLFGGTNTTPTAATLDTVEESGVPLYIPVATGDILTNPWRHNVFRASISDAFTPFLLVRYIADTFAGRRVGLMFESTGYGTGGASRVRLGLRTFNLALVAEVSYNQGDRNFVAQIQTLAQAGVEVLVFYGLTPEAIPALLTAQQLGFLPTVVASAGVVAGLPRDFFALAAAFNLVAPVFVVNPPQVGQPQFDNPQLAALRQQFSERFGRPLGLVETLGYQNLMIIRDALTCADAADLSDVPAVQERLIRCLEGVRGYVTIFDLPVSFSPNNHDGIQQSHLVAYRTLPLPSGPVAVPQYVARNLSLTN